MNILAFDTALGALSAALSAGGPLTRHFELRTRGHAETLLPLLQDIMARGGIAPEALDALAVTVGPGTFTGLRAGLATARGIALARGLPVVPVTTLEAVGSLVEAAPDEAVVVAFDARRNEVYLQAFEPCSGVPVVLGEPAIVSLDGAAARLPGRPLVLAGSGAGLVAARLAPGTVYRLSDASPQPDAAAVLAIAIARIEAEGLEPFRQPPAPLYLRAPDAKLPGGLDYVKEPS
ncbi:MAG: tRNA (adenosine(37)-N6)-threonylcarbamoyltransferase complex dimerization subunit type 1 TsaB [Parvibaculaceae bacterium]|nr:tRNA (adenosine(37)-N6)-threonylcarbamoyltransferase complex dimerization subunit type 1 TsaB [Parvibaculaceae bacterium]